MTLKRILWIVVAIVIVVCIYYWYQQTSTDNSLKSGSVTSDGNSSYTSATKARMDSGAVDLDGRPMTTAAPAPVVTKSVEPIITPAPAMTTPAAPANASLPTSDTLSADPPAGMAFGGSGKFQWYRQGNLTWRINTQTGSTCIAFATMDEWAKPIVYSHGCGNA